MNAYKDAHYTRISKRIARKLFEQGKSFYIIAHKMRPGYPFTMGMTVFPIAYHEESKDFDYLVNNWNYYNASYETGYYPAFYLEK